MLQRQKYKELKNSDELKLSVLCDYSRGNTENNFQPGFNF